MLFSTILAANIGAGSTVGASGLGFSQGLGAWWWVGSAGIGTLVLAVWVGPRIWRLASERGYYTVGDFLEDRYGAQVRGVVAAILWVGTLSILAGQLIALAWVLNVVTGLPKYAGCIIGGLVMTVYFTVGGLHGSARVNLVQLVALLLGFAFAVPIALSQVGGLSGLADGLSRTGSTGHLDFFGGEGATWSYYLILLAPAFIVSPGLLQKVYGGRDPSTVRWGVGIGALALLLFAFLPVLLGMVARVQFPALEHQELALPTVLARDLPPILGGLGLGALFVADVSSADAILFMLATSLSQDLYRRFLNPQASDRLLLTVGRRAAVVGGTLGVLLAVVSPSVVGALSIFYALLGVSLFVPLFAGLYLRIGGVPEAVAAIGAGVVALLVVRLGWGASGIGFLTPNLAGLLVGAAGFGLTFLARGSGSDRGLERPSGTGGI